MNHKYIQSRSEAFRAVTDACSYLLRTDPDAAQCREYVGSRLSKETQSKCGIGYFPSNIEKLVNILGKETLLEESGLVYPKMLAGGSVLTGHFCEHNLIMPFCDVHGQIVSILGRSFLSDDELKEQQLQKYKYTKDSDKKLYVYGLDWAKRNIIDKDYVICVEGQFDCLAAQNSGLHNVVALGWATMSRYQFYQINKYTNNIYLMLDSDEAGKKGVSQIKKRFSKHSNVKSITVPSPYKDIDEFLKKETDILRKESVISKLAQLEF